MKYDIIVVGSGPGGYVAAIRASQLGRKVALVERAEAGGVCLNWGCIPTKALLKSAQVYTYCKSAEHYGLTLAGEVCPDPEKIVARSRGVAETMNKGVLFLLKKNNVELINGFAKLKGNGRIDVDGTEYEADHIILATGARPREMPFMPIDGEHVISSKQALVLPKLPETMIVVGSGAIGSEFAWFYAALGVKVTVVEYMPRMMPLEDEEVSKAMERAFRKLRAAVMTSTTVKSVRVNAEGRCEVETEGKKGPETLTADIVLSAVGIKSNIEGIGLEELGIGRPSTYAPTITTIINRGYVVKQNREGQKRNYVQMTLTGDKLATKNLSESYGKEKNRLSPTDIGMVVNDYLETQFKPIMDYNFTASVEKEFDRIADGDITWVKMIHDFYGPFHQMVDTAIGTQTDKKSQARILGNDPKTGHIVKARIGRYGPMVEIEGEEGQKGRFASLKKGQLIESITLEEALALFALPRDLGQLDGEELSVGIGKYGPYVRHGKSFASLQKGDDPYTLTYERAVEIVHAQQAAAAAANTPLRSFPEEPDMLVKNGRYGAYIAYKGKNYRLPKGSKPEELTLDDCLKIVADSKK